jgi:ketosteroid isomerase-like protein
MTPVQLVQRVTEAFESSDFGPLLEHLDENVVWKAASRKGGPLRSGGIYRGRSGVLQVTSEILMTVTFARLQPTEIVSEGEIVWGLFDTVIAPRLGTRRIEYETAIRFRIRNRRFLEISPFFDTAGVGEALAAAQEPGGMNIR